MNYISKKDGDSYGNKKQKNDKMTHLQLLGRVVRIDKISRVVPFLIAGHIYYQEYIILLILSVHDYWKLFDSEINTRGCITSNQP